MRNPPWARDELILALDLYLSRRNSLPGHRSAEVAALSLLLNRIATGLGQSFSKTYRNVNGVYMKLMNFRRLDPLYLESGKKGLTRGNSDELVVWELFSSRPEYLAKVSQAIRVAAYRTDIVDIDGPDYFDAEEGRLLTRLHHVRERDKVLVRKAKQAALRKAGRLVCEACGFDFKQVYGVRGENLIEAHHTQPLHTVSEGHRTSIRDLALLCANCHRVVHAKQRWLTVAEVKQLIKLDHPRPTSSPRGCY